MCVNWNNYGKRLWGVKRLYVDSFNNLTINHDHLLCLVASVYTAEALYRCVHSRGII